MTDKLKIPPCKDVCMQTHICTEREVKHRGRSPRRDIAHLNAVSVIPNFGYFLGGNRGKTEADCLQKHLLSFPYPSLGVQPPLPSMVQCRASQGDAQPGNIFPCLDTHHDLMLPSPSSNLLETCTDPNFPCPCANLRVTFGRDHGSREPSWAQSSLHQQGLIQQHGISWELGM